MTVEIEKYGQGKLILVVSEIVSVELESKVNISDNSLSRNQYEVIIETKSKTHRVWMNGEKERAENLYQKVKEALGLFYKKDIIGNEIRNYLEQLK